MLHRLSLVGTLGSTRLTGPQSTIATAAMLFLLGGCGGSEPSVPTTLTLDQSSLSFTALGQNQQLTPSVSDQRGDPLPEAQVIWSSSNAGVAAVSSTGLVTAQGNGTAQVTATAGSATAIADISVVQAPAQLQKVSGDGQIVTAGQPLAAPLVVQASDALGNPVSGATVTFTVAEGGGSIGVPSVVTTSDGRASTTFTTGTSVASPQRVAAGIAATSISVSFTATTIAGPPVLMSAARGNNQQALAGVPAPIAPTVRVTDVNANPVAGVAVEFEVISGGGSVTGGSTVTNPAGLARPGSWTLGRIGENQLRATATASGIVGNPVTFTASGTERGFHIVTRFLTSATPSQRQAFIAAENRWENLIIGDLLDIPVAVAAGSCGNTSPAVDETIDDVMIFVVFDSIDGPDRVLASAGPCFIRTSNDLPVVGRMRFDTSDINELEASGLLEDVILHEMAHVLGFGTLWGFQQLLVDAAGAGGTDPHFIGSRALQSFDMVGGAAYAGGNKVPVENTGGPGSADSHWRESVFAGEVMTGFIGSGENPLSAVTVASLADQGYSVDLSGADPYVLSLSLRTAAREPRFKLEGDVLRLPIKRVDARGRIVGTSE
jgi:Leishmanolysin/Bacterial Ig-like domain (group 2)